MPQISAVIITLNEERNIGRCIDSLKEVADEILVVDSFSSDRTESICTGKGVRFVQHAFEGHIEQKNYAVSQASFPFVLSLDADEALSPKLIESILAIKNKPDFDGYYLNRLTNYCGHWVKYCGWYPDRKLRLFNKTKGRWAGTNPHDIYAIDPDSKTARLEGDILHYSYYTFEDHLKQINYFSNIAAREAFLKGNKHSVIEKIILSPLAKFFQSYFLQLGFLDGYYGFIISVTSAFATFSKYIKLRQLWKENDKNT
jgi:glycosyltransferase involved in cell wall biosynthesis